jgi:hypothetical protein
LQRDKRKGDYMFYFALERKEMAFLFYYAYVFLWREEGRNGAKNGSVGVWF